MFANVLHTILAMQPELSQPVNVAAEGSAAQGGGAPPIEGCATQAGLMVLMVIIFYFLLIRPQKKRQQEHEAMIKALSKGDIVRTAGGVRGEIISIQENDVILKIADKVQINILLANIAGLAGKPASDSVKDKDAEKKG